MSAAAAIATCLLLVALAVLQALLACRVPLGRFAWGGRHAVLPTRLRIASVVAILVYLVIGAIVLARAGLFGGANDVVRKMTWVIAAYFLLGAGGNLASRSSPERRVMAPTALALSALTAIVALR